MMLVMIATDTRALARRMPIALLTVREVAFALGCGRTSVYALIARGEIPTVKVGQLTRVPVSAVAQFVSRGVAGACVDTPMPSSPAEREADRRAARTNEHVQGSLFDDAAPVVVRAAGVSLSRRARRPSGRSQG